jgi:hypothetical protein
VKDAAHSMQLGRRGFTGAVDHPADRPSRRRRRRGYAAVLTGVLVTISIAELVWILAR